LAFIKVLYEDGGPLILTLKALPPTHCPPQSNVLHRYTFLKKTRFLKNILSNNTCLKQRAALDFIFINSDPSEAQFRSTLDSC